LKKGRKRGREGKRNGGNEGGRFIPNKFILPDQQYHPFSDDGQMNTFAK
jgi:hypothetical protein